MNRQKRWIVKEYSRQVADRIMQESGVSALTAKVMASRGMTEPNFIQSFLRPSLEQLHDPFGLNDMDKAVERIIRAVREKEGILIYGDYDVDGVSSTAMLFLYLREVNAKVSVYIPDRFDEGYGLSVSALENVLSREVSLLITVDCGVTALNEAEYVKARGTDLIITDHHTCRDQLPDAIAVIHPGRPDSTYPFRELAGAGVVYKLLSALNSRLTKSPLSGEYLCMAALGTVADVVPLMDENRILVKQGLEQMEQTENLGLKKLIEATDLMDKKLTSWSIGFVLAPRINAAGRIGSADRAFELLTTDCAKTAAEIASMLNEENRIRQETEQEILRCVEAEIDRQTDPDDKVLVVAGEGWHQGVIGIVASRITERYYKPCLLISLDAEGVGKGSGRSIENFNLVGSLTHCKELLIKYGGHAMAAGLSIRRDRLESFRERINAYADGILTQEDMVSKLTIDVVLDKKDVTLESIRELGRLAPFGASNPNPLFAFYGMRIKEARAIGGNKHLKMKLEAGETLFDTIGFNQGEQAAVLRAEDKVDVACMLEINQWNSSEKVQLNLKDIKSTEAPPERAELQAIYRYLNADGKQEVHILSLLDTAKEITERYRVYVNACILEMGIEIFSELGLFTTQPHGDTEISIQINRGMKVSLEDSPLYRKLHRLEQ